MDLHLDKEFIKKIKLILQSKHLISGNNIPELIPFHFITINGQACTHYKIKCEDKMFFLKLVKDRDNTIFCLPYLHKLEDKNKTISFPKLISDIFSYNNKNFYILDYVYGDTLDELEGLLSVGELNEIAHKLANCLNILSSSTSEYYSDSGHFYHKSFGDLLIENFTKRLNHPLLKKYVDNNLISSIDKCKIILGKTTFPKSCLIHMDVKPANIIFNIHTKQLTLIDYECARFCDIDYSRIQIYVTKYKNYSNEYTEYILPIISDGLTFESIIANDKLLCYLFYQVISNLMFYEGRKTSCPDTMSKLYYDLLKIINAKEIL